METATASTGVGDARLAIQVNRLLSPSRSIGIQGQDGAANLAFETRRRGSPNGSYFLRVPRDSHVAALRWLTAIRVPGIGAITSCVSVRSAYYRMTQYDPIWTFAACRTRATPSNILFLCILSSIMPIYPGIESG